MNCHNYITEIQNQPGNSNVRTVIRSGRSTFFLESTLLMQTPNGVHRNWTYREGRITVRIHDELQSAVTCELQSALRGAARRPALPGTESPAVPVWDLLGPPALPSATPTASAVRTCPRRNPGGVRPSLAPTARLVRLLRSAASGPVQPPPRATAQARWQLASGFQRKSGPQANLKAAIRVWAGPRAASTSIPSQWRARHTEHLLAQQTCSNWHPK